MMEMLLVLDFGGGYSQALARKVRSSQVYCEILPYDASREDIAAKHARGLLLVGGPQSAEDEKARRLKPGVFDLGIPMLGLGYGARLLAKAMGAQNKGIALEKRIAPVSFQPCALFDGLNQSERYFERADEYALPEGVEAIATAGGVTAGFADEARRMYGVQFHAEQNDPDGLKMLENFAVRICGCAAQWSIEAYIEQQVKSIAETVGGGMALTAMSGGVDSSVCASLVHKAIGRQLHCLYVDTGLMRKGEGDAVERVFRDQMGMELLRVDASERFFTKLRGVTDPETKRRIIGEEFIRVFEEEARKLGRVDYLVQGTIYPDVLESYGVDGTMVKSHHNVGGLPDAIDFRALVEPVRELFKDEVRLVGEALGLPPEIVWRQPFPGPGLSVRCIGEVTRERIAMLREADAIFREEIARAGLDRKIWQYFVVLTDLKSVGVRENARSFEYTAALRAVHSVDAMSATPARLPYDLLERVVERITSEVPGINRVVYDVTGKPPATIEWE